MTKKTFETPTIERVNFTLSDATLCAVSTNNISGIVSDAGIIQDMLGTGLSGMLGQ